MSYGITAAEQTACCGLHVVFVVSVVVEKELVVVVGKRVVVGKKKVTVWGRDFEFGVVVAVCAT